MPRTKSTNQYYGKFFECAVTAVMNGEEIENKVAYEFTEDEKELMISDGKQTAKYLIDHGFDLKKISHIGDKTSSETGDLITDDGIRIELKYIGTNSTGTYHNTSLVYFRKFGFDFKDYMKKFNFYETLKGNLGSEFTINEDAESPVTRSDSSVIRHKYSDIYTNIITPADKAWREAFNRDIFNYFKNNPDKAAIFLSDVLNKTTGVEKEAPDKLIAFNYNTKKITDIDMKSLLSRSENTTHEMTLAPLSFTIDGVRCAISWQNGAGLNNPTLRIFIS